MIFMNEHDIDRARETFNDGETSNLGRAARFLSDLRDWTNNNSDGWAYWDKPRRSAVKLQELLSDRKYLLSDESDITDAQLRAALAPIKAFLTRQRVAWSYSNYDGALVIDDMVG